MIGAVSTPPPSDELATLVEDAPSGEAAALVAWRLRRLRQLGIDHKEADNLARLGCDLHLMERLVAEGCPPITAWRIAS